MTPDILLDDEVSEWVTRRLRDGWIFWGCAPSDKDAQAVLETIEQSCFWDERNDLFEMVMGPSLTGGPGISVIICFANDSTFREWIRAKAAPEAGTYFDEAARKGHAVYIRNVGRVDSGHLFLDLAQIGPVKA